MCESGELPRESTPAARNRLFAASSGVLRGAVPKAKIAGSFPASAGIYFALREGLI
jgi:hypothetical protein